MAAKAWLVAACLAIVALAGCAGKPMCDEGEFVIRECPGPPASTTEAETSEAPGGLAVPDSSMQVLAIWHGSSAGLVGRNGEAGLHDSAGIVHVNSTRLLVRADWSGHSTGGIRIEAESPAGLRHANASAGTSVSLAIEPVEVGEWAFRAIIQGAGAIDYTITVKVAADGGGA